jgi:P4 family phage/plasmid primase-like protien
MISYDEDDYVSLFDNLQLEDHEEVEENIMLMAYYHLNTIDCFNYPESIVCNRFDAELALMQLNEEYLSEFRIALFDHAKHKLEFSCNSSNKSDMDFDLCTLFYEFICGTMVYSGNSVWYFNGIRWVKSDGDHYIWNKIHVTFKNYLCNTPSLHSASVYLDRKTTRDKILSDIKKRIYYPDFQSKLDSRRDIIGVSNGVLELHTGILRKGKLSDFISKSTDTRYIPHSMESREIVILLKMLRKVFPIEDLLHFFIRSCSTFLEGENSKKVFYVWWGSGNNCKTGMATLVQAALGNYCATAPVSLITSKRGSSSEATPEMCHIEGKLVVFLQEPNPKEKIKTGRIKELTGNDKVFVRNLYQSGREIDVKCKIVHVCNFPTAGPDNDKAFKRRMKVIKFPSTFLEQSEYNSYKEKGILEQYMYRVQDNIDQKFKLLGSAFLSLMLWEYQVFKEVGLQTPEIVEKNTEEFLTYNNIILKFIRQQLKHERGAGEVDINQLYETFKVWTRAYYPSYNIPNLEAFIKELHDEGFQDDNGDGIIKNILIMEESASILLSY